MKYKVEWTPAAEDTLMEVWLASADKNGVTAAVEAVGPALARSPLATGVALDSSVHRVARRPPRLVEFSVVEDDKKVVVQGVAAV